MILGLDDHIAAILRACPVAVLHRPRVHLFHFDQRPLQLIHGLLADTAERRLDRDTRVGQQPAQITLRDRRQTSEQLAPTALRQRLRISLREILAEAGFFRFVGAGWHGEIWRY